ncbi:LLM class flavin-dependent oxidoreductase [Saccharopolyspora shandongensis]|uniref:LLM class flavin-dependent oxidoreductase n=1 Tax=Saccharopolyspora shandongensis TaxID=418495 RepID=UPI003407BDC2
MRFSINIPNFGDFADPATVAKVAAASEQAGWDALFVWDHVVHDKDERRGQPFGDPWMLLTAAALATSRLRLGTLVAAVARRRPEQLARQVATLDSLSGGRVIFSAGLGGPIDGDFASFGEPADPVVLAERLDEGLDLLQRYWSGEPVNHRGRHYYVDDVTLLPASVQRPRPPVWIGGVWPHRRPMRRAAPRAGTAWSPCSRRRATDIPRALTRCGNWSATSTGIAWIGGPIPSRSSWAASVRATPRRRAT